MLSKLMPKKKIHDTQNIKIWKKDRIQPSIFTTHLSLIPSLILALKLPSSLHQQHFFICFCPN